MDTERLLKELEKREIVSKSVLSKLADKLADKSDMPSPRAVAKFLVDNGHLTTAQAKRALRATLTSEESAILDASPLTERDEPDLPDLPSLSGVNLAAGGDPGGTLAGPDLDTAKSKSKSKGKKKKKKTKGQSDWDSPLILLGGGGLILMLLVGGAILFLLGYESADQRFQNGQDAYDDGSYPQAIADFEEYLEKHPNHTKVGEARVRLGTARIRMVTEVQENYEDALGVAKEQTDIIEDQPEYKKAQAELTALLPTIARELADKADQATEIEAIQRLVGLTEDALVLCKNPKLIPNRLRDQGDLNEIRETLERIRARQVSLEDLRDTLAKMTEATDAGDPKEAYNAHTTFVKEHPELSEDERVIQAVAAAAKAEEALVQFVAETIEPETAEPESPVAAELAVASPLAEANAPATGVAVLRLAGGLYGVSAADGKLVWRRSVGIAPTPQLPITVDDDLIAFDARRQELVRLHRADGQLVWRVALKDDSAQPALVGGKVLCPCESGRMYVIDAATGQGEGYVQFAQPLSTTPAVSRDGKTLYLTGEHSSLYSLSTDGYACLGVMYLGHAKGSVESPPIAVNGRVMVFENDGASTSTMHVLGAGESGAADRRLKAFRLKGLVENAPNVFARRFAVVTDTGQVEVYEVSAEDSDPIVPLATRRPTRVQRGARYAAVVNGNLWLADTGLAKYSISPSGNRLPVREVEQPFRSDSFVHPLAIIDGVVIHARKRRGKPGVAVGATDLKNGKVYWQTNLGPPPAGAPVSQTGGKSILLAVASGSVFRVDSPSARYGVVNTPIALPGNSAVFEDMDTNAAGDAIFWATTEGLANLFADGQPGPRVTLPGEIACPPARLGDGWVTPLLLGQVHVIRSQDGAPMAAPYQPALTPGETRRWRTPATFDGGFVIADDNALTAIDLIADQPPRLEEVARAPATGDSQVIGRLAAVDGLAFAARRDGRLTALDARSLDEVGAINLDSRALWGPYASGSSVLVATAAGELVCVNAASPGEVAWRAEVATEGLVGQPLDSDGVLTISSRSGVLYRFDLASGEPQGSIDVGQALATGAANHKAGLLLGAADGSLLFVNQP